MALLNLTGLEAQLVDTVPLKRLVRSPILNSISQYENAMSYTALIRSADPRDSYTPIPIPNILFSLCFL